MRLLLMVVVAALGTVGVVFWLQRDRLALPPGCPHGWERHWSDDSTVTLCLPPGFGRVASAAWVRPFRGEGSLLGRTGISIDVRQTSDTVRSARTIFGEPFGPNCQANCREMVRTEDGRARWAGIDAEVLTGVERVGGVTGRDIPVLLAWWRRQERLVVQVVGHATSLASQDTLLRALHTVWISDH